MGTTTFTNGSTLTDAEWFNDTDAIVYDVFDAATSKLLARKALGIQTVIKTANETVTSSTTLQADDHLIFSAGASEQWLAEYVVGINSSVLTTCGFKWDISAPGATVIGKNVIQGTNDFSYSNNVMTGTGINFTPTTDTDLLLKIYAHITTTSAVDVTFAFSQVVSNGTGVSVVASSYLIAHKILS